MRASLAQAWGELLTAVCLQVSRLLPKDGFCWQCQCPLDRAWRSCLTACREELLCLASFPTHKNREGKKGKTTNFPIVHSLDGGSWTWRAWSFTVPPWRPFVCWQGLELWGAPWPGLSQAPTKAETCASKMLPFPQSRSDKMLWDLLIIWISTTI